MLFVRAEKVIHPEIFRAMKDTPLKHTYLYELKCSFAVTLIKADNFSHRTKSHEDGK